MKKILLLILSTGLFIAASAQTPKTELYDIVKKLLYDSTGYENVGDWAVGKPKKYPVKWNADKVEMSYDTSINFYRRGTADISIKGKTFLTGTEPVKWNVMLKGPRMGYASFSILSSNSTAFKTHYTIDSLFGNKSFKATLLKSCDSKSLGGYYYYELKIPKKDLAYIKFSWISLHGSTAIRIDVYDNWSKYAVKLNCPQ
ncbi:MAG: hypothetical protein H7Y86_02260 [Rhizobacter sp.]|nr:hypothetical protein [Ferruginibacter sp.]